MAVEIAGDAWSLLQKCLQFRVMNRMMGADERRFLLSGQERFQPCPLLFVNRPADSAVFQRIQQDEIRTRRPDDRHETVGHQIAFPFREDGEERVAVVMVAHHGIPWDVRLVQRLHHRFEKFVVRHVAMFVGHVAQYQHIAGQRIHLQNRRDTGRQSVALPLAGTYAHMRVRQDHDFVAVAFLSFRDRRLLPEHPPREQRASGHYFQKITSFHIFSLAATGQMTFNQYNYSWS